MDRQPVRWITIKGARLPVFADGSIGVGTKDNTNSETKKSKEKEIYKNMHKRGRLYKAYGKWGISYPSLYVSIKEAGYTDEDKIFQIMDAMIKNGYIRPSKNINGKTSTDYGFSHHLGNYIIEKWVND